MNIEDAELITEFVTESQEHLGDIETDFLTMELQGSDVDLDLVNKVFRAIHSIKGAAGFMGLPVLESLAHREEEVLNCIRNGEIVPTVNVVSTLLKSTDMLKQLLESIETSNEMDVSERISDLDKVLLTKQDPKVADACASSQDTLEQVIQDVAAIESTPPAAMPVSATDQPSADAAAPEVAKQVPAKPDPEKHPPAAPDQTTIESSIRVDVGLLDMLMNQVGELVLARNQLLQFAERFEDNEYSNTSQRLNLITSELQEAVMKTRMQPIGSVWSKFPRLVRDLSQICKKEVRIEMEGKETELDKTIIEAIKDPLTHLVRNNVDHGIETPEVREAHGKSREGCLTLRAFHEGGQVNIEISDDGAGLNLDRIKEKAIEKGIITAPQAQAMQSQELSNLIFAPGFSTAETVSNVSGRGVGMDVVKTNIERIGGTLDLETTPGLGTTVRIKIPLTLAIIPALLVTCAERRYAIPQVNLMELVRLEGEQSQAKIEWIQNAPVYRLRGNLLPLVDLRKILKCPDRSADEDVTNIVVLRADDQHFGLVVDRINDTEEIVVKPLSQQTKELPVFSGATILGDGRVALILDVMGIAQSGRVLQDSSKRQTQSSEENSGAANLTTKTLLILKLADDRRVAMPMSQVARLEQVPKRLVETANSRSVIQYRGEILPLIDLATVLGIPPQSPPAIAADGCLDGNIEEEEPIIHVVVYTEGDQSAGLVVDQILDIVETDASVTEVTKGKGLLGSAIIEDRVVDLLDLSTILQTSCV